MARRGRDAGSQQTKREYVFKSAAEVYRPPDLVQTGIVALDAMIGGGIPRGRFVELFGPSKGGKTALGYEVVRAFQQSDPKAKTRWTDAEHAFDGPAFQRFGGDMKRLDFDEETDTVEEYTHRAEAWIRRHAAVAAPKLDVLDSVAMLGTKHENETDMSKKNLDRAGLIYRGFRRLGGLMSRTGTTLVFVNQVRDKVGVYFGSPETTTGGKGPEYFATIRLRIAQGTLKRGKKVGIWEGGVKVGVHFVVRVEKNRLMPESQETELRYLFASGFDGVHGVLRLLANNGLIDERSPRTEEGREIFTYGGKVIDDPDAFVDEHPELLKKIWGRFRPENA